MALHIPATDRHHQTPLLSTRELPTPTEPRASVRFALWAGQAQIGHLAKMCPAGEHRIPSAKTRNTAQKIVMGETPLITLGSQDSVYMDSLRCLVECRGRQLSEFDFWWGGWGDLIWPAVFPQNGLCPATEQTVL